MSAPGLLAVALTQLALTKAWIVSSVECAVMIPVMSASCCIAPRNSRLQTGS
jgi:hypothetical protein